MKKIRDIYYIKLLQKKANRRYRNKRRILKNPKKFNIISALIKRKLVLNKWNNIINNLPLLPLNDLNDYVIKKIYCCIS
jgi:hypothetical protein